MMNHDEFSALIDEWQASQRRAKTICMKLQEYGFGFMDFKYLNVSMLSFGSLVMDQIDKCKRIEQRGMIESSCAIAESEKKRKSL